MIPFNKPFRILALLMALNPHARAEWTSDAFGLFDAQEYPARLTWAGLQQHGDIADFRMPLLPTHLQILMAEKSMIAGRAKAMAVALGTDIYGNLMGDGLPIAFTLTSQDQIETAQSHRGLSYVIIRAATTAGLYSASARVLQAEPKNELQSERQIYRISADLASLNLALAPHRWGIFRPRCNPRFCKMPMAIKRPMAWGWRFPCTSPPRGPGA